MSHSTFTLPNTELHLKRVGYGAMQLAGPRVSGPPADRNRAVAVVKEAVESGVNHIDTSDFYGPHVVNEIIKEALYPYPKDLTIVTKLGAKRGPGGSWDRALSKEDLIEGVHSNLKNLGLDALDVVNLRVGPPIMDEGASIEEQLTVLAELQNQGLIRHIGLSNIVPSQFEEALKMVQIVCVQNEYNVIHRRDDVFINDLAQKGVAYVPYFPLGGFTPLQSSVLNDSAASLNITSMQLALAWLLQRSPNILLIPGTSSPEHLRENLAVQDVELTPEIVEALNNLA